MYTIYNNVEGTNIFQGNEKMFLYFMRQIAIENDDEDMSITCLSEAKEYIENYCDNLDLQIN